MYVFFECSSKYFSRHLVDSPGRLSNIAQIQTGNIDSAAHRKVDVMFVGKYFALSPIERYAPVILSVADMWQISVLYSREESLVLDDIIPRTRRLPKLVLGTYKTPLSPTYLQHFCQFFMEQTTVSV